MVEYTSSTSFDKYFIKIFHTYINVFPLMIMTAAFALFSLLIFLMKYNTEVIKIKNKGLDRL